MPGAIDSERVIRQAHTLVHAIEVLDAVELGCQRR